MPKDLVISATPYETRVAILEDGQLCEIYIEREKEFALVGSIYKGRVTRVLPGMQSAFVDIGLDSDAFLYVSDFLENLEEYDHIVTTVEGKVQKMEQQGGQVFATPARPSTLGAGEAPEIAPPVIAEAEASTQAATSEAVAYTPAGPAQAVTPPASPAPPPYQQRDREAGGYGRDRGRHGRWGRRGRGDRRHGRDLPPSKYASSRPYEPRPHAPSSSNEAPILLPGESLAKYKDRLPTAPAAPPAQVHSPTEAVSPQEHTPPSIQPVAPGHSEESAPVLPESLYVGSSREMRAKFEPIAETEPHSRFVAPESAEPIAPAESSINATLAADVAEQRTAEPLDVYDQSQPASSSVEESQPIPRQDSDLSEDEVTSLAEQLKEAKQEEARAEAEDAEAEEAEENEGPEEGEDISADILAESYAAEGPAGEAAPFESLSERAGEPSSGSAPATPEAEQTSEMEAVRPPQRGFEGENNLQEGTARIEDRQRARFQRPMRRGGRHRGGRPHHHDRHLAPRRPQLISEMLKANQEIIVQIAKEPLGKKGARITSHVALPGRFLVYMPTVDHIGVSRKIASAENRSRLRRLVSESKGTFPGGFIVRTAAENASDDEIRSDVEFLGRTWDEIRTRAEQRKAPTLLHRDLNLVERILRDYLSLDYSSIWIDSEEEFSKVVDFVSRFQPKLVSRVKLYTKETPIFEEFGIQQELDKALRPKVWLKSGGYIVINHTEALVAIDVNTGKYVGRGSTRLEDTIVKTNLEAVKEIVRQIRLRDLGGIIVVDFIDMEERRNREKVMAALDAALQSDRAPSKVLSFNEFGLVAITRKRTKQALERVLCQPCPYCTGSGMVKSVPTICYEIQAEARKMSADLDSPSLTLRVNPEIAKALKTRESSLIEELEQATRKSIIIQADASLHWEQYDIY